MKISSTRLQPVRGGKDHAVSAQKLPSPPAPTLVRQLDLIDLGGLRDLAGVKKPGLLKRFFTGVTNLYHGVNLALAAGPNIGHLVMAKELSKLRSAVTGEPEQAPLDWMRENRPESFLTSLSAVMEAGSAPLQQVMGLSLTDLAEVEQHYYRVLAPVADERGVKTTAPYLRELARLPDRQPGQPSSAFVFLGEKRSDEANSVTELWNSSQRPPHNPFSPLDRRFQIWENLARQEQKGHLPIFVDMDGDYSTFTGTEFVAKKTLSSLGERNNSLGDDFADPARYFSWLSERQESYSRDLEPYLQKKAPAGASLVSDMKQKLTPPWLDGPNGMGPFPAPREMETLGEQLDGIRREGGTIPWIDALVSLDRDLLTGVQTYWIKLLRELKRPDRAEVLKPLPAALFETNLLTPQDRGFADVAPADGPNLSEIVRGEEVVAKQRPYDRAVALKEVLDHALDGLGIEERREMLSSIRGLALRNMDRLEGRESRLRESLGPAYAGLEVRDVLAGKVPAHEVKAAIAQLLEQADGQIRTPTGQEARRHASMLGFLFQMETRYGEVDQILGRIKGDFSSHPLGVSEFFIPPAPGARVSPLREAETVAVRLGNGQDPDPTKISLVFEGGGGRGFAYPECLKQLEGALMKSANGYEVDEYIGTSAGAIVAVMLAAGFNVSELREVMESIDFTAFNADAAWLMGGVDPKVRGIDRTGLFSTQKMYQTFHELLSKKLGVEGRPVLFSDLPHKLKMVTALINTDLPEEDPLRQLVDPDGRLVFSNDTTPNFDVAGALAASAAVPAFFQLPQILVARPGQEEGDVKRGRIQLADGGVVDNLSISSASTEEEKRTLLVLPAHTHTIDPETGQWVGLDTLNFSTTNLELVDAHNRRKYAEFAPKLDDYFQRLEEHGVERAVIGFNLTKPSQQPLPAVQGSSEALSLRSLIHAKDLGIPVLDKEKGDSIIRFTQRPPGVLTNVVAELFDRYVDNRPGEGDGQGQFHRTEDGFHYHPGSEETSDLFRMAYSVGGVALSASKSEYQERKFEKS